MVHLNTSHSLGGNLVLNHLNKVEMYNIFKITLDNPLKCL